LFVLRCREERIAQLSFFFLRRSFFACSHRPIAGQTAHSAVATANEVERSNILAPGLPSGTRRTHLLPAFTPECFRGLALGSRIQLQQRNCSRFARDFSRRSTFSSSQRTAVRISGSRSRTQAQIWRVVRPLLSCRASVACRAVALCEGWETSLNISLLTTFHRQK